MKGFNLKKVWALAGKEVIIARKDYRILIVTLVFILFSLILGYFGSAPSGKVGVGDVTSLVASLVTLSILITPLIGLFLGIDSVVGEKDRGTLGILLAAPLSRIEFLLGKFLGLGIVISLSIVIGLGLPGMLIGFTTGFKEIGTYFFLMGTSILLGIVFLGIAITVSTLVTDRSQALIAAVIIWFFYVVVYDLSLLGGLIVTKGELNPSILTLLLLLNPTDVFRIINLQRLGVSGFNVSVPPNSPSSDPFLLLVMLLWLMGPMILASIIIRKKDY